MNAPDSLKILINDLLDKHWEDILRSENFYEAVYDPSYNEPCKIKVQFGTQFIKEPADRFTITIITKYNME